MKALRLCTIFFAICLVSSILTKLPTSYATVYTKPVLVLGMADGYASQYDICYPYLENKSLKPFIYPISDLNGSTFESQPTMNWTEINELIDEGYDLVSHSATHPHMDTGNLNETELIAETQGSQERFKNETGTKPHIFAVPFGDRNATVNAIIDDYYNITLDDYANCVWNDEPVFQYNASDIDYQFIPTTGLGFNDEYGNYTDFIIGNLTQQLDWLVGNGSSYAMILGWHTVFADIGDCRGSPYSDIDQDTWEDCIDIIYDYWQEGENITIKELNTLFSGILLPLRIGDITHDLISIMCDFVILGVVLGMFSKIGKIKVK